MRLRVFGEPEDDPVVLTVSGDVVDPIVVVPGTLDLGAVSRHSGAEHGQFAVDSEILDDFAIRVDDFNPTLGPGADGSVQAEVGPESNCIRVHLHPSLLPKGTFIARSTVWIDCNETGVQYSRVVFLRAEIVGAVSASPPYLSFGSCVREEGQINKEVTLSLHDPVASLDLPVQLKVPEPWKAKQVSRSETEVVVRLTVDARELALGPFRDELVVTANIRRGERGECVDVSVPILGTLRERARE